MHPSLSPQFGERTVPRTQALAHGRAAAAELGLTVRLEAVDDSDPGAWLCTLHQRDGQMAHGGLGMGKGDSEAARVGAVFEALEHHLSGSGSLETGQVLLRDSHRVAAGPLNQDVAVRLLQEAPAAPIACLRYRALAQGADVDVPVFLSMPDYLENHARARRSRLGDGYDYRSVGRYSVNSGWASGATVADASVHALNEIIERDAFSLLLAQQFLTSRPTPLRVVDRDTLPDRLGHLLALAESRCSQPVHLVDMTTDLGVPAYLAYVQAPAGQPSQIRGCGASLAREYAIERALTELVQLQAASRVRASYHDVLPTQRDHTAAHPRLHACYLADFSAPLSRAVRVPFAPTVVPGSPAGHLAQLLREVEEAGYAVYRRVHHRSDHLAVVNVFVPGLERFMIVTDGSLVLPGRRGLEQVRAGAATGSAVS